MWMWDVSPSHLCRVHMPRQCRGNLWEERLELPHSGYIPFHMAPTNPPQTRWWLLWERNLRKGKSASQSEEEGKKRVRNNRGNIQDREGWLGDGVAWWSRYFPLSMDSRHRAGFKLRSQHEGRAHTEAKEGVVERNCYGPTTPTIPRPPALLSVRRDELAMDWSWAWEDGFGSHYVNLC